MSSTDAFDMTGRVAVVTGAASGIGRACSELLAARGASVMCADTSGDQLKEVAEAISSSSGTARARVTDVSREAEVGALVNEAVEVFGRLDVMCNIAGIMHTSTVVETNEADLDRVLAVNLKGTFFGCQAAARVMCEQEPLSGGDRPARGSIVNMVSSAIDAPAPGIVAYAMSKAAGAQLTRTLAVEVGRLGVRVNAVAPGFVVTGMTSRHFRMDDGSFDEERKEMVVGAMGKMAPLRRVGDPGDIAHAVLYLASDASSFVTGQVLRVNGGVSMP